MTSMSEPPAKRSASWRWWVLPIVLAAAIYAYVNELHLRVWYSERVWMAATIIAGVLIVLGWLAQNILPFADLFGGRRKPPRDS
jgi:hypothetical protein